MNPNELYEWAKEVQNRVEFRTSYIDAQWVGRTIENLIDHWIDAHDLLCNIASHHPHLVPHKVIDGEICLTFYEEFEDATD